MSVPGGRPYAAVASAFLIHSTVSGTWAPRLPAIKDSLDLSDGELGTALVGLAIGLVAGTRLAGAPIDRFGKIGRASCRERGESWGGGEGRRVPQGRET